MRLRIGSRGSQLALWQADHIAAALRDRGHEVAVEIIQTTGDRVLEVPRAQVGATFGDASSGTLAVGKGIFTKEIEEALAAGRIDLAVHSLKDLPTALDARFALAAVTRRADARDVFISHRYVAPGELPPGARVGTSSLRRQAQLAALRSDLQMIPLRGNVDTRLRKLAAGEFDA